jgi:hypothetical protein
MASLALTLKGVRADKRRRLVSEGVPKIKFGSVCHIQRLGHLRQTDIHSRCAGADEVQHLARCHTEVFRHVRWYERRGAVRCHHRSAIDGGPECKRTGNLNLPCLTADRVVDRPSRDDGFFSSNSSVNSSLKIKRRGLLFYFSRKKQGLLDCVLHKVVAPNLVMLSRN